MARRSDIDWDAVARDYALGRLTNDQLSKKHDVATSSIKRKAKELGWRRDLSENVRAATKAALIEEARLRSEEIGQRIGQEMGRESAIEDQIAVAAAVSENVAAVLGHRRDITALRALVANMAAELAAQTGKPAQLEQLILAVRANDPNAASALAKMVSLPSRASAGERLVNMLSKLIDKERQALNIDDKASEETGIEAFLRRVKEAREAAEAA